MLKIRKITGCSEWSQIAFAATPHLRVQRLSCGDADDVNKIQPAAAERLQVILHVGPVRASHPTN